MASGLFENKDVVFEFSARPGPLCFLTALYACGIFGTAASDATSVYLGFEALAGYVSRTFNTPEQKASEFAWAILMFAHILKQVVEFGSPLTPSTASDLMKFTEAVISRVTQIGYQDPGFTLMN